jgi:hypothetical protein
MDKEKVLKDLELLKKQYTLQTLNMVYNEVPRDRITFYQGVSLGLSMGYNLLYKEGFSEKQRAEVVEELNFIIDKLNEHEEKMKSGMEYRKVES